MARTRSLTLLFIAGLFGLACVAQAEARAGTIRARVDCAAQMVTVENSGAVANVDVDLEVVVAQYPQMDPGCRSGRPARMEGSLISGLSRGTRNARAMSLAHLGMAVPATCRSYMISVRATRPGSTEVSEAHCVTPQAEASLEFVSRDEIAADLQSDLIFYNKTDLAAIDGSCIGIAEYVVSARNVSTDTTYDVSIDAKYICSTSTETPVACPDLPNPPGIGWNRAIHTVSIDPGECGGVRFLNGADAATLPRCCDSPVGGPPVPVIVQCAQFSVTGFIDPDGFKAIRPAYFGIAPPGGAISQSSDGEPHAFGCSFFPTNQNSEPTTGCPADCDLDGIIGRNLFVPGHSITCDPCEADGSNSTCDNCPCDSNVRQADLDGDGAGDPCDDDDDNDGVPDSTDNCPRIVNGDQDDTDGDGIGDPCDDCTDSDGDAFGDPGIPLNLCPDDNCPDHANPGQGPVVFEHQIDAPDPATFSWPDPVDIIYVRGNLSSIAGYATDWVRTADDATSFPDISLPPPGEGFYYLVRIGGSCTVGSWQSAIGAEAARDAALP